MRRNQLRAVTNFGTERSKDPEHGADKPAILIRHSLVGFFSQLPHTPLRFYELPLRLHRIHAKIQRALKECEWGASTCWPFSFHFVARVWDRSMISSVTRTLTPLIYQHCQSGPKGAQSESLDTTGIPTGRRFAQLFF